MATSFKNPNTPTIASPVNLDRPIQALQQEFASELSWLEKSFGRTWMGYRKQNGRDFFYPEAWDGGTDKVQDLLCNDNLDAYSFFKIEDPQEYMEYAQGLKNRICLTINIVFWLNLQRIDPSATYRNTEVYKVQISDVIRNFTFPESATLEILRIYEEANNVYLGYSISLVENQVLVYPHAGFRFECRLCYKEDCP